MPVIGAATTAHDIEAGAERPTQIGVAAAEIDRIAGIEIGRIVEFGVTARLCIGAQSA